MHLLDVCKENWLINMLHKCQNIAMLVLIFIPLYMLIKVKTAYLTAETMPHDTLP